MICIGSPKGLGFKTLFGQKGSEVLCLTILDPFDGPSPGPTVLRHRQFESEALSHGFGPWVQITQELVATGM